MAPRAEDRKTEHLEKAFKLFHDKLGAKESASIEPFFLEFWRRVAPDDVLTYTVESLYGATLSLWKFSAIRKPGTAKVRLYNPRIEQHGWKSSHTVLEIVNDDMPFLVDSVAAAISGSGFAIHALIHPVVHTARGSAGERLTSADAEKSATPAIAESIMHVEIDEQTDPAVLAELERKICTVLADVRVAVDDWRAMLAKVDEALAELDATPPPLDSDEVAEGRALLAWMQDNHFTFLGYREYAYRKNKREEELAPIAETGLGLLRDPKRRVLRRGDIADGAPELSPLVTEFMRLPELIIVTKAAARSTVHRPVYLDYVGVKRFGEDGAVVGERRFIGLFTSSAYNRSPREIPYLRRRVQRTLERSGLHPTSHDGKALLNILETYPRDELFQAPEDELYQTAIGILGLEERPRIRLFARRDKFERFFSCLVFVPRERYTTDLRRRFEAILTRELSGRVSAYYTQVGDQPLARIHFIIGTPSEGRQRDVAEIEAKLVEAARSWDDDLYDALNERWGEETSLRLWQKYGETFPTAYKESFNAQMALSDIDKIEELTDVGLVSLNLYRLLEDEENAVRFKIYHPYQPIPLSDCLPMLENMGLKIIEERPYEIGRSPDEIIAWIHDFLMIDASGRELDVTRIKEKFEVAFENIWLRQMEDDGFNQLVLRAGLDWRDVVVLRAICKYLRQTGITFSQDYMEDTLAANPAAAGYLAQLFHVRFQPGAREGADRQEKALVKTIGEELERVESLDEDRILRHFLNLIRSTVRTNFFQAAAGGEPKSPLAFKIDSSQVAGLPLPRPFREIFVYSPRVEGIHLRGGRVARGGLRWSDRREDYRTEILGLMKAQMVKNAVIVPVGSKGGFVPKRLPGDGDREAILAEGVACYKTFVSGLLDVTDNLTPQGVASPPQVVRHDDDDPYLVVAADKGTATFSDIANEIAESYGFWLGDAFASGGKAGYDHKKMAITARGAWESVKRHFREMGHDTQSADFTVAGCGDMSGDVFGNGMLLSKHIKLLAAFDHRHIFVDPDPDPGTSWDERKRLFDLPRSSWADYDAALISKGGGVFDRKAKAVKLSAEMKKLFRVDDKELTPGEMITLILKLPVDLLWFGGIGTYVKARYESHADAGDRANDQLRIDASELACKVVGEGANLGVTQRARIEFALAGGRINTDFVDNSAGVDCSDHEVNIKILLNTVVEEGEMTRKQRDRLLAEMTDEVGLLVLHDNYLQTQALTVSLSQSSANLANLVRLMRNLERRGLLNREIEFLPDDETLSERQADGSGLVRPELCVLLAYAKMALYDDLLGSDLPDDHYFAADLRKHFPRPLRRRYVKKIIDHRLRREIVATIVANVIVNRAGPTFISEMVDELNASPADVARAFIIVRDAFGLRKIWTDIQSLDNRVPAAVQTRMIIATQELLRRATMWFLRNGDWPLNIRETVDAFDVGIHALSDNLQGMLGDLGAKAFEETVGGLIAEGVPEDLARCIAALEPLGSSLDIVQAAREGAYPVEAVGRIYFAIGARLGLDWLRSQAELIPPESHWERMAIMALVDDLFSQQRALTNRVLESANGAVGLEAIDRWAEDRRPAIERSNQLVADFRASGGLDVAKLAIANRHVRGLIVG